MFIFSLAYFNNEMHNQFPNIMIPTKRNLPALNILRVYFLIYID